MLLPTHLRRLPITQIPAGGLIISEVFIYEMPGGYERPEPSKDFYLYLGGDYSLLQEMSSDMEGEMVSLYLLPPLSLLRDTFK